MIVHCVVIDTLDQENKAASIVDNSEMNKSNANLYHVKQLLGHKSFETLNHYARLDITDLRKTHERCHPREKDEP
jgi:site-specific recombinase XerC